MAIVEGNMALVRLMSPYWDSHMSLPVLKWMKETNLLDGPSCDNLSESILPSTPAALDEHLASAVRQQGGSGDVHAQLATWERQSADLEKVLSAYKKDQQKKIAGYAERKRLDEIFEWYTEVQLKAGEAAPNPLVEGCVFLPFQLGRIYFAMGEYRRSLQQLDFYLNNVSDLTHEGSDLQTPLSCVWGICACILLLHHTDSPVEEGEKKEAEKDLELLQQLQDGEDAKEKELGTIEAHGAARCILKLADVLDQSQSAASKAAAGIIASTPMSKIFTREEQLHQRAWLLHWGMWLLYRYYLVMTCTKNYTPRNPAWSGLLDWLLQERNLTCVHLLCPHLLRYYAVYAILTRKRKDHFQAVVAAIGHTKNKYSDAFTSLLEALFLDFNFDKAQQHIASIDDVCSSDFFLAPLKNAVNEHARLLIFETYCRIHKCINVDMIAKKVNMAPDAAERWIVNLIRHARLEARIDSEKNRVQMSTAPPNLYQQVIEKTRNMCVRSNMVFQNLNRPGYTREDDTGMFRGGRGGRGRGRQWVHRGSDNRGGASEGYSHGNNNYRDRDDHGGRHRAGRTDPMSQVADQMAHRRHDDLAFAE